MASSGTVDPTRGRILARHVPTNRNAAPFGCHSAQKAARSGVFGRVPGSARVSGGTRRYGREPFENQLGLSLEAAPEEDRPQRHSHLMRAALGSRNAVHPVKHNAAGPDDSAAFVLA